MDTSLFYKAALHNLRSDLYNNILLDIDQMGEDVGEDVGEGVDEDVGVDDSCSFL